MKKFLAILIAATAACVCAHSQSAQNSPAASEPQISEQAAVPSANSPAEDSAADASLSPEEIEHQKIVEMRDREALHDAYTVKGKMARFVKALIGDNEAIKSFLGKKIMDLYVGQYLLVFVILVATFVFTRYLLGYIFKILYNMFKRGDREPLLQKDKDARNRMRRNSGFLLRGSGRRQRARIAHRV